MKQILTVFAIGFLLFSCNNDGEIINNQDNLPLVTKMSYPIFNSENPTQLIYFVYDNSNRLTKKTGGFLQLASGTGYSGFFTNEIYTSLVYDNNKVTVENFSTSTVFKVPKNTINFTLNNAMQIEQKEVPNISTKYGYKKQVYNYSNSKLVEIKTTFPNIPYDPTDPYDYLLTYSEIFSYDSNGNLAKTEFFEQHNGINKEKKIVRIFENYDKGLNPWKRFYLLDEYFYRSISKNNYRKYTEVHYNNEIITSSNEVNWTFLYDSKGNILTN